MKIPPLDLGRAYALHAEEIDARLQEVARSGAYILGKNVAALEEAVADYLGTRHAVAVGSGTDALHLAVAGLGIGPGDEVITTPFTFAATVEAIEYVGAQPVLVDIDPDSYNMDADLLEGAMTSRTRGIIPVHMFGQAADMAAIMDIAGRRDILLIEDCAQSFGATIGGRAAGSFGHAGAFSFYPTKVLACLGDGGMISTNDPDLDRRLRELRNHGIGERGEHVALGFNSRLDELQATVLRVRLEHIDEMNERRRQIAVHYNSVLSASAAKVPLTPDRERHVYGYYTILVEDRDGLRARLADAGISTAIYYPKPLHLHAHFAATCRFDTLKVAERVAERCISLPIFPEMTDDEVDYVASTTAALLS
jgi:dTDP-4-amino-4,6-dideoxygalactose transaminase